MKLIFLLDHLKFSGGRKTFLEYAAFLKRRGHDVRVLCRSAKGDLSGIVETEEVERLDSATIPSADLLVATTPEEVEAAFASGRGRVVHLCQGFEIDDLEDRIAGKVVPARYMGGGLMAKLRLSRKKLEWKRMARKLHSIYSLDTELVAISPHLKDRLEKRFGKKVRLVKYGVKTEHFFPLETWSPRQFTADSPCRIINVGPIGVTFKGIPDTIEAARILKKEGVPARFIRVSPDARKDGDLDKAAVDEYHKSLSPAELGKMMRACDIYISNSLEGEGFGLPAMEALSCGLLCILSSISSYRNFSEDRSFAVFVPERNPIATATAVKKIIAMPHEERAAMRNRAVKLASGFSFEKAAEHFEKTLGEILALGR